MCVASIFVTFIFVFISFVRSEDLKDGGEGADIVSGDCEHSHKHCGACITKGRPFISRSLPMSVVGIVGTQWGGGGDAISAVNKKHRTDGRAGRGRCSSVGGHSGMSIPLRTVAARPPRGTEGGEGAGVHMHMAHLLGIPAPGLVPLVQLPSPRLHCTCKAQKRCVRIVTFWGTDPRREWQAVRGGGGVKASQWGAGKVV